MREQCRIIIDLQVMKMCRSAGLGCELQEQITQVLHTIAWGSKL